ERALDASGRYRGPYWRDHFSRDKYVFLQAHRWLDKALLRKGRNPLLVGEWVVAERFPVARGEYVGRAERVEVPVWRFTREEFEVASGPDKRHPGIPVEFRENAEGDIPEAILVDFRSESHSHIKAAEGGARAAPRPVSDAAAVEVLLLTPEGHLA